MVIILSAGILFLLGASFASFAGMAVHRLRTLPPERSAWTALSGRSRCDGCGAQLTASELVPVAGWLMAGGRCVRCGHRVSAIYPVSEAIAGGGLVAVLFFQGLTVAAGALAVFVLLIVLGVVFLAMRGRG